MARLTSGDATVDAEANVPVTGVEADGVVGTVTMTGTANVFGGRLV